MNFTWTRSQLTVEQAAIVNFWKTPYTDVFINLFIYLLYTFIFSIIASTIPVPSGIFIPVFKIGAAFGRLVRNLMKQLTSNFLNRWFEFSKWQFQLFELMNLLEIHLQTDTNQTSKVYSNSNWVFEVKKSQIQSSNFFKLLNFKS